MRFLDFSSIVTILLENALCKTGVNPIVEVLPKLEAEGYRVTSDECVIFGQRNIDIEKGDVAAEIVCVPYDFEEYQEGNIKPEDADWWVDDVFENGESYQETF